MVCHFNHPYKIDLVKTNNAVIKNKSLKGLKILYQERRGQMNTIMMENLTVFSSKTSSTLINQSIKNNNFSIPSSTKCMYVCT